MNSELNAICLDAEMTDRGELLELSIFSGDEQEIYHHYFKPRNQKTWRTNIHHITPEMVANEPPASKCAPEIATIVKQADCVIGCAVDNDLGKLSEIGINIADRQRVIDIQLLHFYVSGNRAGDLANLWSLLKLTEEYGVAFSEEEAHGASADTDATLRCFYAIMDRHLGTDSRADKSRTLQKAAELMRLTVAELAKGFILISKTDTGYRLESRYMQPKEKDDTVLITPVDDRFIAEYELRRQLARRAVAPLSRLYRLRASDLDAIRAYRCLHDPARSSLCRALLRTGI